MRDFVRFTTQQAAGAVVNDGPAAAVGAAEGTTLTWSDAPATNDGVEGLLTVDGFTLVAPRLELQGELRILSMEKEFLFSIIYQLIEGKSPLKCSRVTHYVMTNLVLDFNERFL